MRQQVSKILRYATIIGLIMAASFIVVPVIGQSIDSAAGTVTIGNATPSAATVEYVDSVYATETNFDPDNTNIFGINVTITDANTIADLANITWYFFDESVHGDSGGDDWDSASTTGNTLIKIQWNESDDAWTIDDNGWEWDLQSPVDPGAAYSGTSFEFTARFDISRAALAASDWNATVIVYDDQDATDTAVAGSTVTMNNYFEIAWSASTFTWGSVSATSTNNTMSVNRTISFWANAAWELVINGTDFTAGGESDVDIAVQDVVMWSDVETEQTGPSLWLRNAQVVALGTWDAQSAMSSETPLTRSLHFWFNDPGGQFTADVLYDIDNLWIEVRADT